MASNPYDGGLNRLAEHAQHYVAQRAAYQDQAEMRLAKLEAYYQQMRQAQIAKAPPPIPQVYQATEAFLNEDGLVIEVAPLVRVRIPRTMLRTLQALVTMAEMAHLMPAEPVGPDAPASS